MIRGRGFPTEIYNRIDTNINFLNNDDKDEGGRNSNRNINSVMMTRMMTMWWWLGQRGKEYQQKYIIELKSNRNLLIDKEEPPFGVW